MIAVHGQYGPAASLSGQERDERLHLLLDRMGRTPLMNVSSNDREVLRQLGHMEQTQDGRRYVNGRAMSSEAADMYTFAYFVDCRTICRLVKI